MLILIYLNFLSVKISITSSFIIFFYDGINVFAKLRADGDRKRLLPGAFKGLRKDPRKGETGFWDRVTHIEIRGCLLIPIACASFSSLLSRSTAHSVALSLSFAAHKHANEGIPHVYTRGPVDGGQRLISVSPTLLRVEIVLIRDRPRYRRLRGKGKVRQSRCILVVSALHRRHGIVITCRTRVPGESKDIKRPEIACIVGVLMEVLDIHCYVSSV